MHSKMRTANLCATCVSNQTLRRASVIRPHVKSRDGKGMESKKRNKTEESADLSDICIQLGLHVRFFFFSHYLNKMGEEAEDEEEEEGTEVLIKMKDCNNSPTTPIVITSIPLPSVFLDVLTRRNGVMHRTV